MRFLPLAFCLLATPALAASQLRAWVIQNDRVLTREQGLLRNAGNIARYEPSYACDYTKGSICGAENWYRRLSSNWTYRNASGYITYAPNNLFTNSAAPTGSRTIATDGNGKYILKCSGTGSISYLGIVSGSRSCPGEVLLSPAAGNITLTVSGSPTNVRFSEVLHETTLPAADDFNQGSVAWQPPRIDSNGWLLEGIIPDCCGEGTTTYQPVKNLLTFSNALSLSYYSVASADTTVTAAAGVISPDGTQNAWRMANVGNSNDGLSVTNPVTVTSGGSYSWSFFIKRDSAVWAMVNFLDPSGPTNHRAWFNIQTGAAATTCSGCAVSIVPDYSGNGWYRVSIGRVSYASTSIKPTLRLVAGDNTTTGCVCAAYVYGWQLDDRGAGPFSYSPTNGQIASRDPETAMSTDARLTNAKAFIFEVGSRPQRLFGATGDVNLINFNSGPSLFRGCGSDIDCGSSNIVLTNTGVSLTTSGELSSAYAPSLKTSTTASWSSANRFAFQMGRENISLAMNGGAVVSTPINTAQPVTAATWSSDDDGEASFSFSANYQIISSETVTISGATPSEYNGTYKVSSASPGSVTVPLGSDPGSYVSGAKILKHYTQGALGNVWLDIVGGYLRHLSVYRDALPAHVLKEKSKRQ